jgi:hypothetical protein
VNPFGRSGTSLRLCLASPVSRASRMFRIRSPTCRPLRPPLAAPPTPLYHAALDRRPLLLPRPRHEISAYRPLLSAPLAPCSASACRVARRSSVWPEKMMGPQNGHVGYAVFLLHIHPLIIHILLLAAHGRVRVAACKTRGISAVLLCISIAPLCELLSCRAPTSSSVARVASMDDAQPLLEEMPPRWVCIEHSSH